MAASGPFVSEAWEGTVQGEAAKFGAEKQERKRKKDSRIVGWSSFELG